MCNCNCLKCGNWLVNPFSRLAFTEGNWVANTDEPNPANTPGSGLNNLIEGGGTLAVADLAEGNSGWCERAIPRGRLQKIRAVKNLTWAGNGKVGRGLFFAASLKVGNNDYAGPNFTGQAIGVYVGEFAFWYDAVNSCWRKGENPRGVNGHDDGEIVYDAPWSTNIVNADTLQMSLYEDEDGNWHLFGDSSDLQFLRRGNGTPAYLGTTSSPADSVACGAFVLGGGRMFYMSATCGNTPYARNCLSEMPSIKAVTYQIAGVDIENHFWGYPLDARNRFLNPSWGAGTDTFADLKQRLPVPTDSISVEFQPDNYSSESGGVRNILVLNRTTDTYVSVPLPAVTRDYDRAAYVMNRTDVPANTGANPYISVGSINPFNVESQNGPTVPTVPTDQRFKRWTAYITDVWIIKEEQWGDGAESEITAGDIKLKFSGKNLIQPPVIAPDTAVLRLGYNFVWDCREGFSSIDGGTYDLNYSPFVSPVWRTSGTLKFTCRADVYWVDASRGAGIVARADLSGLVNVSVVVEPGFEPFELASP